MEKNENSDNQKVRPPIIVVMGHVDHGKTTLLDFLRETKIAEREAGGITQSIGAYEIEVRSKDEPKSRVGEANGVAEKNGQRMTFIDTPGHEAFMNMRKRGAKVADVAILVVAADSGVQPQTEEAFTILNEAGTPFVVAINKIDKNNADIEKAKQSLLAHGIILEGFGGSIPWVSISAKTGDGVEELLDIVMLLSQMNEQTYNAENPARGFIIESEVNNRAGILVSLIIKDGTLRTGDYISTQKASGKIKGIINFIGKKVDFIIPSSPALVLGFDSLPSAGDEFVAGKIEIEKRPETNPAIIEKRELQGMEESVEKTLNIVLKSDVSGTLEALEYSILALAKDKFPIKIIHRAVGDISDGDINTAMSSNAIIVGFNVKTEKSAQNLARSMDIKIFTSNIIYKLIEMLEDEMKKTGAKEEIGVLEILAIFSKKGKKQVIGGKVTFGFLTLNQKFEIRRGGVVIGYGKITNLQQQKQDKTKVEIGECGLMVDANEQIEVGDQIAIVKV